MGHGVELLVLGDADQRSFHERGVGERAEDIKDGPKSEGATNRREMRQGVVEGGGEEKANASALDAGLDHLGGRVEANAEGF